jgi:hypothetical protein
MTIVAESSPGEDGRRVLVTTTENLAAQCGVDRGVIRRALAALVAGRFCTVASSRGSGGNTTIGLTWSGHSEGLETIPEYRQSPPTSAIKSSSSRPLDSGNRDHSQAHETVCESPAIGGDHGHSNRPIAAIPGQILDLDLRSEDLSGRSSTPEDLSNNLSQRPSEPAKPKRKPKIDPSKISARAWDGADYMRKLMIAETPDSLFASQQWAGQGGRRLAWAHSLQRLHDGLARAAKLLEMDAAGRAALWDEIARTVFWLYNRHDPSRPHQGDESRFVVESPDSLSTKWDKIQLVRRNQAAAVKARAVPRGAAPDNRPPPEFKRMSEEDDRG